MNNKTVFEVFFKIAVVIALAVVIFLQIRKQDAIVYVDSVKLLSKYKGMEAARTDLNNKSKAWQANLDTLRAEIEEKIKEYEIKKGTVSARERGLMEELINTKQEQYVNYQQVISEKMQSEDQQLTTQVLSKVNDYIKRYGEDNGYTIIMAATQYGNIVYAKSEKDITDEVLAGLNAEYGK